MASVTLTLTDTHLGGIACHTDFTPAIGKPCSPAQAAALDIINRTRAIYGLDKLPPAGTDATLVRLGHGGGGAVVMGMDMATGSDRTTYHQVLNYEMKKGVALVLLGKPGSGKSTLALRLAESLGEFSVMDGSLFAATLRDHLAAEPKTLLVEGDVHKNNLLQLKQLITQDTIQVRKPYDKKTTTVRTPNVIICTTGADWIPKDDRRFEVIEVRGEFAQ